MSDENKKIPLTPAVFHILLALSGGELHGYGIMKQVEAHSQGKMKMGAGTLYGSIKRMLEAELVTESDKRIDPKWVMHGEFIIGLRALVKKHWQTNSNATTVLSL